MICANALDGKPDGALPDQTAVKAVVPINSLKRFFIVIPLLTEVSDRLDSAVGLD